MQEGHPTHFSIFWKDTPEGRPHLIGERVRVFYECSHGFGPFFHTMVNGDRSVFRDGLTYTLQTYFLAIHVHCTCYQGMIQIFTHIPYKHVYVHVCTILGNKQFNYNLYVYMYLYIQVYNEIFPWYLPLRYNKSVCMLVK